MDNADGQPIIVLPGRRVTETINQKALKTSKIVLGPGLRREKDEILATKCGILKYRQKPSVFWVDSHQKRYCAIKGERVVGVVVSKGSMTAKVDIGTSELATLSLLAFEGATKKNRPNIQVGDVLYARVLSASKDLEAELVCVNSKGKKEGMGLLPSGGFMITVPLDVIRKLLTPDSVLLKTMGLKFRYEIAIGMNGRIWVKANSISTTIFVSNSISQIESMTSTQFNEMCKEIEDIFEQQESKH